MKTTTNTETEARRARWNATIEERGNGLPDVDSYVPGDDGNLYRITALDTTIHTGSGGGGDWIRASVELADWASCPEDEVSSCAAIVGLDEAQS